jgi:hypothetical protein
MNLNEYKQYLDNLDPTFGYADDYRAYIAGKNRWDSARRIANAKGGLYKEAWKAYNDSLMAKS